MIMQDNWDRLRLHYGVGKLKIELARGSDNVINNKRSRPADEDDNAVERPAQQARHETDKDEPEGARALNRSMSQLSIELTDVEHNRAENRDPDQDEDVTDGTDMTEVIPDREGDININLTPGGPAAYEGE